MQRGGGVHLGLNLLIHKFFDQSDEKFGFSRPTWTLSFDRLYDAFSKPKSLNEVFCVCLDLMRYKAINTAAKTTATQAITIAVISPVRKLFTSKIQK